MNEQNTYQRDQRGFIPEGLEYRDEYWRDALSRIRLHEDAVRKRRRRLGILIIFALIGTFVMWNGMAGNATDSTSGRRAGFHRVTLSFIEQSAIVQGHIDSLRIPGGGKSDQINSPGSSASVLAGEAKRAGSGEYRRTGSEVLLPAGALTHSDLSGYPVYGERDSAQQTPLLKQTPEGGFSPSSSIISHIPELQIGRITSRIARLTIYSGSLEISHSTMTPVSWKVSPWEVQAVAGGSVITGYATPHRDQSFDPFIRISVSRNLNRRYALEGGLEFMRIGSVNAPFRQVSTQYDFSYVHTITTVHTRELYYLTAPVMMKMRLLNRLQIGAGGGLSYLLRGTNEIIVDEENPTSLTEKYRYRDDGYITGFRSVNAFLQGGFIYALNRNSSVAVTGQYGLSDITRNEYFGDDHVDRNSRLMIEYRRNIR